MNRRNFLKSSILASTSLIIIPKLPAETPKFSFPGICYGPFRRGQSPGNIYPSEAQIREDLQNLKLLTTKVRTYGSEAILGQIPRISNEVGIDCYPGAWIDTQEAGNQQQLSNLITIANQNYPHTKCLVIGNETLLTGRNTKSNLLAYISQVKSSTSIPVTTAEPWHLWADSSNVDLANLVDKIMIHVHPYWESPYWSPQLNAINGAQHVLDRYNQISQKYPGKQIIVGETGWPTSGAQVGSAIPSIENQLLFLQELRRIMPPDSYFVFEAYDESWKGSGVEGNWGIFDENSIPKQAIKNIWNKDNLKTIIKKSSRIELQTQTLPGQNYSIESSSNTPNPPWSSISNFTAKTQTQFTTNSFPFQTSSSKFYRIKTN
ncbi:MAG: glycosyl hydrolase family 17 protein [Nanoarchaeota archaeon]